MTIGVRAAAVMTAVATVTIGVAALTLRSMLQARLGAYAPDFTMMRSMMGDGPNLPQIFRELDRTIILAILSSIAVAVCAGIALGATLSRSFRAVNRGLGRFAEGKLEIPIRERGPLEIRRVARNANSMALQLAASRATERELVAGVVHDLAHPITALRATIDAVREGLLDTRDPTVFTRMFEAVTTLEATTNDLRDVAEFNTGALTVRLAKIEISEIARHVASVYEDFARRRGVVLQIAARPMTTYSDARRLERLVDNLIVNAIAATPAGGSVRFGADLQANEIVLSVRDGAGNAGAARLAAALRNGEGSGLGLRVVHAMADALHARLTVESDTTGSTVFVRLANVPSTTAADDVR